MGLFRQQKAIDRLEDRLARLENTCTDLERQRRKLNLEFTDLYDKVSHQMSRMAKRHALAKKANDDEVLPDPDNETSDGLDPISRSIMMRRGLQRPSG